MLRLLADHNVEGYLKVLVRFCASPEWAEVWESLECEIDSFERLGLLHDTIDTDLWHLCQERGIVLFTANRNADGPDSLETTIRSFGTHRSLPVLTISDANRLLRDRNYAEDVAAQFIEYLVDLEEFRGTGRLYIP